MNLSCLFGHSKIETEEYLINFDGDYNLILYKSLKCRFCPKIGIPSEKQRLTFYPMYKLAKYIIIENVNYSWEKGNNIGLRNYLKSTIEDYRNENV